MNQPIDGIAPAEQNEFDRLWKKLDDLSVAMSEWDLREARRSKLLLDLGMLNETVFTHDVHGRKLPQEPPRCACDESVWLRKKLALVEAERMALEAENQQLRRGK